MACVDAPPAVDEALQPMAPSQAQAHPGERVGAWELLALLALLCLCRLLAISDVPLYDDAFITYRYALNLARGAGLVYNPGAAWEPVLGTTTPAYAVLLAGCARLGLDPALASRGINLLCDGASALLIVRLLERRRAAVLLALILFAALPHIARISAGGMEAPLLLVLALGATVSARERRLAAAGLCAAIACTVRPEAVLLAAWLVVVHGRSRHGFLRLATPIVLVGVLSAGALEWVYGSPIPESVRAKADSHMGLRLARMAETLRQAFYPSLWMLPALPLVLLGWWTSLRRAAPTAVFLAFALSMTAAYLASGAKTWGWYHYVPLTAWALGFALGAQGLLDRSPALAVRLHASGPRWVGACALCVALFGLAFASQRQDRITQEVYAPMRAWCERVTASGKPASILASDIGAVGYFADTLILDSAGLVWPDAQRHSEVELIRDHHPDYILMVVEQSRLAPFLADPVRADYKPIARFNAKGLTALEPALAEVPDVWTQDYLVWERLLP